LVSGDRTYASPSSFSRASASCSTLLIQRTTSGNIASKSRMNGRATSSDTPAVLANFGIPAPKIFA
jgi:hypothetical protein